MGSSLIDLEGPIACAKGVDLNISGDYLFTPVPNGNRSYIVTRIVFTNASEDLTGGAQTLGIFDGVGGSGNQVLAVGLHDTDTLTSPELFLQPAPAQGALITSEQLYLIVADPSGINGTIDCYLYGVAVVP